MSFVGYEFGRVYKSRKLRVNVDKSKVIRCSRYVNGGRMEVRLNSKSFEEVDCLSTRQQLEDVKGMW